MKACMEIDVTFSVFYLRGEFRQASQWKPISSLATASRQYLVGCLLFLMSTARQLWTVLASIKTKNMT